MVENILENVRLIAPHIHCITNYVTANDCANMLLACGASPIMADDPMEVEEITDLCEALVINIGTLNDRTIPSMLKAGKRANERNIPVIFDPVGIGASRYRTETAFQLLENIKFTIIRGNASEIKTLYLKTGKSNGVDVSKEDQVNEDKLEDAILLASKLNEITSAIIVITGEIDMVVNGKLVYIIRNGHPMMSRVTGTGCMLTSVIGALCAANPKESVKATVAGVCAMGICGEIAYEKISQKEESTASFKVHLIDAMSKLDTKILMQRAKIENRLGNTAKQ